MEIVGENIGNPRTRSKRKKEVKLTARRLGLRRESNKSIQPSSLELSKVAISSQPPVQQGSSEIPEEEMEIVGENIGNPRTRSKRKKEDKLTAHRSGLRREDRIPVPKITLSSVNPEEPSSEASATQHSTSGTQDPPVSIMLAKISNVMSVTSDRMSKLEKSQGILTDNALEILRVLQAISTEVQDIRSFVSGISDHHQSGLPLQAQMQSSTSLSNDTVDNREKVRVYYKAKLSKFSFQHLNENLITDIWSLVPGARKSAFLTRFPGLEMTDSIEKVIQFSRPLQVEIMKQAESDIASYIVRHKKTTIQEEPSIGLGRRTQGLCLLKGYTSAPAASSMGHPESSVEMYSQPDVPNSLNQPKRIPIIAGDLPEVEIPILAFDDNNTTHRAVIMAYHYSMFVLDQGSAMPSNVDLVGSMLGLVLNTLDLGQYLMSNNKIPTYCRSAGFIPIIKIMSDEEDIRRISDDHRTQSFLGKFGAGMDRFMRNRDQQLVMLGPILLTIGYPRNLTEGIHAFTRRIDAFMKSLGLETNTTIWTHSVYPTFSCLSHLESFLSSSFLLRRELFHICSSAASGPNRLNNLFKDVVDLLKETGTDIYN
jgi:hypothetical protein